MDIFINNYNLDLGYNQEGEEVQDVQLPKWSEDLLDFTFNLKASLESELTSIKLNEWIDLIFGCNSRGENAINNLNVYHEYAYKDNVNLSQISSKLKIESIKTIIDEYG